MYIYIQQTVYIYVYIYTVYIYIIYICIYIYSELYIYMYIAHNKLCMPRDLNTLVFTTICIYYSNMYIHMSSQQNV